MTIYLVLYISLILSCLLDNSRHSIVVKKNIILAFVMIFTLFRGLRWENGTDWAAYLIVFETVNVDNLFTFLTPDGDKMETGYLLLNALTKCLGGNYTVFLLFTNFFILFAYYKFSVRMSKYPIMVFTSIMLSVNFFPVRQDLAVAIIYFAFIAYVENNKKKALIYILIAYTIHHASICAIAFFLMDKKELSYSKVTALIVICFVSSFFIKSLISACMPILAHVLPHELYAKISVYLLLGDCVEEGAAQKGIISYFLIFVFIYSGLLFYKNNKSKWNEVERRKWLIILNTMIMSFMLQFLMNGPLFYLTRMVTFYVVANNILIVHSFIYIFNNYKFNIGLRVYPYCVLFLLFLFRFYRMTTAFPTAHFPYHFVLSM